MAFENENNLLEVKDLHKDFPIERGLRRKVVGTIKAIDGISFVIKRGETLALVGESGSGKTTTGRCLMRAIEPTSGNIIYNMRSSGSEVDMMLLDKPLLKKFRKHMGMIFQDPYASLNPRRTVFETVSEAYINHRINTNRKELEEIVAELLGAVKLAPEYMLRYPHAFSGGQRQRIAIARAIALKPEFVVADEPVSALDVSVQAQILNLLKELQSEYTLTYLFIAHNLAVVKYISDRVAVMYVGRIVELADTEELFGNPKHPYTEALLSAVPDTEPERRRKEIELQGEIADPANPPGGCSFHPRCNYAKEVCRNEEPKLVNAAGPDEKDHFVACHFADKFHLIGVE